MKTYRLLGYSAPTASGLQAPAPLMAAAEIQLQAVQGNYICGWVDVTSAFRAAPDTMHALVVFLSEEAGTAAHDARKALQAEIRHSLGIEE